MLLHDLEAKKLISPPKWLSNNCMYLSIIGSHAYGVADTSDKSKLPDYDVYGWTVPPKDMLFPHLSGHIQGLGTVETKSW